MNWQFLVPLLDLTFPVYKTLIWVLRLGHEYGKSEVDKQLDFVNHLLTNCGFIVYSQTDRRYIKQSKHNLNLYMSAEINTNSNDPDIPGYYHHIGIKQFTHSGDGNVVFLYQLEWRYQDNRGGCFLFWDGENQPPVLVLQPLRGDYYQSRSAFMTKFQSLLDSL